MTPNRREFVATSAAALSLMGMPRAFHSDDQLNSSAKIFVPTIERSRVIYQLQILKRPLLPIFLRRLNDGPIAPGFYGELKCAYLKIIDQLQQVLVNKVGHLNLTEQYQSLFGDLIAFDREQKHRVWIPRQIDPSEELAKNCFTQDPENVLKFVWRFPSATTLESRSGLNLLLKEIIFQLDNRAILSGIDRTSEVDSVRSLRGFSNEHLMMAFSRMSMETYFALIPTMFFVRPNSPIELLTIHSDRSIGEDKNRKEYDIPIDQVDLSRLCGEVMQIVGCNDLEKMRDIARLTECEGSWMCFHAGMVLEMLYFKATILQFVSQQ